VGRLEENLEHSEKYSEQMLAKLKGLQGEIDFIREENLAFKKKVTKREEVKSMSYLETVNQISSLKGEMDAKDARIHELETLCQAKAGEVQQLIAKLDKQCHI